MQTRPFSAALNQPGNKGSETILYKDIPYFHFQFDYQGREKQLLNKNISKSDFHIKFLPSPSFS